MYHEAAHAVLAKHFGRTVTYITVIPNKQSVAYICHDGVARENETHEYVYINLAGVAIELLVFGDYQLGCADDIQKAHNNIRDIIEYGYSPNGLKYYLSDKRQQLLEQQIDKMFTMYLNETKELVAQYRAEIDSYVDLLGKYGYLTKLDLKCHAWNVLYWKRKGYRYILALFIVCLVWIAVRCAKS